MYETQLELDVMYQHLDHGQDGVYRVGDGFRGRCLCGWVGPLVYERWHARVSVNSHLARTEPGAKVVALLRKP